MKIRPAADLAQVNTIAATHALARRGIAMKVAKTAVERMVEHGEAEVAAPKVEPGGVLVEDLRAAGVLGVVVLESVTA